MELFLNPIMVSLQKGLDAGALRQRTIANNIANVNTPGFKKSTVAFESLLKKAWGAEATNLKATHPRHLCRAVQLKEVQPRLHRDGSTFMRTDGNNVDIDEEMTNLAANGIQYQLLGRELSERFSLLRCVITGGKG
ncbi:MAG: flagellar basal body rod protein FlgB [Peptococcaceae bacterium]|nr:flagellar basal body rod protein FlgB [Candidatus Syntrophopropionicum ammoniitolerans]